MNIKKGILIIAIALILAFFVGYGIEVFDPTPNYDRQFRELHLIYNEPDCVNQGGLWRPERPAPAPKPVSPPIENGEIVVKYEKQAGGGVIAGVIAVAVGLILNKDTVSTGVVIGGVLLILYGTIRYWRHANNILKFVMLGVALAILIWFAYKKIDLAKEKGAK